MSEEQFITPAGEVATPASLEELNRAIAHRSFSNRVKQSTTTNPPRMAKVRCDVCPARNRYVREYKTDAGKLMLCTECAELLRLQQLKKQKELEAVAP